MPRGVSWTNYEDTAQSVNSSSRPKSRRLLITTGVGLFLSIPSASVWFPVTLDDIDHVADSELPIITFRTRNVLPDTSNWPVLESALRAQQGSRIQIHNGSQALAEHSLPPMRPAATPDRYAGSSFGEGHDTLAGFLEYSRAARHVLDDTADSD